MFKVKVGFIWQSHQHLENLCREKMPIDLSLRLARIALKVGDELQLFDKKRIELLTQFLPEGTTELPKERVPEFSAEYSKLAEVEVELPGEQFSTNEFAGLSLSAETIANLFWLFKEGEVK